MQRLSPFNIQPSVSVWFRFQNGACCKTVSGTALIAPHLLRWRDPCQLYVCSVRRAHGTWNAERATRHPTHTCRTGSFEWPRPPATPTTSSAKNNVRCALWVHTRLGKHFANYWTIARLYWHCYGTQLEMAVLLLSLSACHAFPLFRHLQRLERDKKGWR